MEVEASSLKSHDRYVAAEIVEPLFVVVVEWRMQFITTVIAMAPGDFPPASASYAAVEQPSQRVSEVRSQAILEPNQYHRSLLHAGRCTSLTPLSSSFKAMLLSCSGWGYRKSCARRTRGRRRTDLWTHHLRRITTRLQRELMEVVGDDRNSLPLFPLARQVNTVINDGSAGAAAGKISCHLQDCIHQYSTCSAVASPVSDKIDS